MTSYEDQSENKNLTNQRKFLKKMPNFGLSPRTEMVKTDEKTAEKVIGKLANLSLTQM